MGPLLGNSHGLWVGDVRPLSGGKIVNASLILWIETESATAAVLYSTLAWDEDPCIWRRHLFHSYSLVPTDVTSFFSGHFLYLLGKPLSSQESLTDKRLISSLIAESGPNCTLEATVYYTNVRGTNIEVATQTVDKAYTPIQNFVLQTDNQTSNGQ